jgi:hypothetical protein
LVILLGFGIVKRFFFISSSFYGQKLPMGKICDEKHHMPYINKGWDLFKPKKVHIMRA